MDVASTIGVAEVNKCRINHHVLFALFQKVLLMKKRLNKSVSSLSCHYLQVAEVSVAASDPIPRAVLVQDKHHARGEPALETQY